MGYLRAGESPWRFRVFTDGRVLAYSPWDAKAEDPTAEVHEFYVPPYRVAGVLAFAKEIGFFDLPFGWPLKDMGDGPDVSLVLTNAEGKHPVCLAGTGGLDSDEARIATRVWKRVVDLIQSPEIATVLKQAVEVVGR